MLDNTTEMFSAHGNHGSLTNGSRLNETCCPEQPAEETIPAEAELVDFPFTIESALYPSFYLAIGCGSVFMNALLLWAIASVDIAILRAKRFIQSLSIANMLLPVWLACDPFFVHALASLGGKRSPPHLCYFGIYAGVLSIFLFVQAFCGIALATDRVFSVIRPLTYSTVGYGRRCVILLYILPWFLSVTIYAVFMLITLPAMPASVPGAPVFCYHLLAAYIEAENSKFLDGVLGASSICSFLVYISIFGILKINQRRTQRLTQTGSKKKASLSLARTYFLVNLTSLFLYLPTPLFSVLTESALGADRTVESSTISSGLVMLYMCNTFIDPLILITRIRSIRQHLPIVYKTRQIRQKTNSPKDALETVSAVTSRANKH